MKAFFAFFNNIGEVMSRCLPLLSLVRANLHNDHFATYCDNTALFLMTMIAYDEPFACNIWTNHADSWFSTKARTHHFHQKDFNITWTAVDFINIVEMTMHTHGYAGIELDMWEDTDRFDVPNHVFVLINSRSGVYRFESYANHHLPTLTKFSEWKPHLLTLLCSSKNLREKLWNQTFNVFVKDNSPMEGFEACIFIANKAKRAVQRVLH